MSPTVRTPSEYTINGIPECAAIADNCSFEFLLPIVTNGQRRRFHFQADANPQKSLRLVLKLKRFEILMDRVGDFSQHHGLGIFNLFLGEKRVAFAFVTTVGAVARHRTCYPSTRRDLEIAKAILNGAFSAEITLFVSSDRDAELAAEPVEIGGI